MRFAQTQIADRRRLCDLPFELNLVTWYAVAINFVDACAISFCARAENARGKRFLSLSRLNTRTHTHTHSISRPVTVQFDTLQCERLYCHCDQHPKNEKSDFCYLGIKKFYKKFVNQKVLPISQIVSVKIVKTVLNWK